MDADLETRIAALEEKAAWSSKLNQGMAMNSLKHVEWMMNLGNLISAQAALLCSKGIMSPPQAVQQLRTIRALLETDPNTAEVLTSIDRWLAILPGGDAPHHPPTAEIVPSDVLERLRAMKMEGRREAPTEPQGSQ